MIIYFFTIILLFAFSLIEVNYTINSGTKKLMMLIIYILLVAQIGLRWNIGTDWEPYFLHFKTLNNFVSTNPFVSEYGYNFFVGIVRLITGNYTVFLLLHSLIYYFLIFKSFKTYSPFFFISLLLFYSLSMGMMGSNRQLIALAICLYALRYVIEKKPIHFFLLIFVAINFHITAILFVVYYFINRNINSIALIIILAGSFVFGKYQLPLLAFSYFGNLLGGMTAIKTSIYLNGAKDVLMAYELPITGLLKRLIFLSIFYFNRKSLNEELPFYNVMLNGYIIGVAFYFLFASSLLTMISRGSVFFNVMEPLLITSQLYLFKLKTNRILIVSFLLFFSIFSFFQAIDTYPELFIPYKGVIFNSGILK